MPKNFSAGEISAIASPYRAAILHHHGLSNHPLTPQALSTLAAIPPSLLVREVDALVQLGFLIRDEASNSTVMNLEKIRGLLWLLSPDSLRITGSEKEEIGIST